MIEIFVDADACPMKDEVYAVAARHGIYVTVVANMPMGLPSGLGIEMVVVDQGPDAADDWIADHVRPGDVVITADIPLADRCLKAGAAALGTNGRPFTEDSIGSALAGREISAHLREIGATTRGPSGITPRDRSRFSSSLEALVQAGLRAHPG